MTRVWETTPLGRIAPDELHGADRPPRSSRSTSYELTIPAGSRSGKHWKMADEILYVLDGEGYSLHWEVEAEIAERYYARIAKTPTRHEFQLGRHALHPAEHDRPALRGRRDAPTPALGAEPRLQTPRL